MPNQPIETDTLIIGSGPVGLFQVFQLGLLEVKAQVIDSLPYVGGQCIELYPDKPIFDIPGTVRCTGRELTANLLKQIEPFKAGFHLGQVAKTLETQADGRFLVSTSKDARFCAKTIVLAAGVGAFEPRRLHIDGLDQFDATQVFYNPHHVTDPSDKHLLIVGGDDAALACAVGFSEPGPAQAKSVTLLHRREVFQAAPELVAKVKALCAAGAMTFQVGQITGCVQDGDKLTAAQVSDVNGQTLTLALDALLVFSGLSPKLGPIADWGLDLQRKQVVVDTEKFSTGIPGFFAVGDINTYPGKRKLIVSGFHEATLAAYGVAAQVFPDQKRLLQYTTTSPRLHALLGVNVTPVTASH